MFYNGNGSSIVCARRCSIVKQHSHSPGPALACLPLARNRRHPLRLQPLALITSSTCRLRDRRNNVVRAMGCSSSAVIKNAVAPQPCQPRILGVSLEYLQDFVKRNGGQDLAGLTCYDVCSRVIKPMTLSTGYGATTGRSVALMLHAAFDTRPGDVQPAHWHVSPDAPSCGTKM